MPRISRRRWVRPALAAVALVPALFLTALPEASAAPPADPAISADAVLTYQVRAVGVDPSDLAQELLADGYDVAGRSGDVLYVLGTTASREDLASRSTLAVVGSDVVTPAVSAAKSQDDILPRKLHGRTYETFYGGYRTVDAFQQFEEDLTEAYPGLVQLVTYGQSFTGDNPLRALCITAQADKGCERNPDSTKTRFLLMAQIHARELTTSEIAWRLATYLVDGKGRNAGITALLNDSEIWIVPETNPDGIETSERGIIEDGLGSFSDAWQRKNMNPGERSCGNGSSSQIGVDLNRNYDAAWGGPGTSGEPCSLVFRGTSAASEPETDKMQELLQDLFVDQRGDNPGAEAPKTTNGAMITMHTYSNLVLFPYGSGAEAPNDSGLRSMAFRMSHFNGYETGRPPEVLYEVTGSTDDFAYQDLGIAAFTYEIGPASGTCAGFFPAYDCQGDFWELNRDALIYGATAAQQPYTQGEGPTIVSAKSRLDGDRVQITGTADDDAYGNVGVERPAAQNVVDARLFVGKAPWEGGKAQPVDVIGSGEQVDFSASLNAGQKEKKVYLQAKDAQGNWGPVEVVWRKKA